MAAPSTFDWSVPSASSEDGSAASRSMLSSGPYVVERVLGRGGMAVVHVVRCTGGANEGGRFAAKRILPEFAQHQSYIQMFCDEASLGQRLRHPNVVRVVDFGEQDGELLLVTEYLDGTSCSRLLSAVARAGEAFPMDVALFVACEILEALAHVHEVRDDRGDHMGVVHRDVSPGNILVGAMGEVKLADFGVARHRRSPEGAIPGPLKGKLAYMSPEQIDGKAVDWRSDLFSLGIVLFEMLTGRPFMDAADDFELLAKMHDVPLSPLSEPRAMRLPLELRLILTTAIGAGKHERFASATEFGEALRGFARRSGTSLERRTLARWLRRFDIWPLRSGTYPAVSVTESRVDAGRASQRRR